MNKIPEFSVSFIIAVGAMGFSLTVASVWAFGFRDVVLNGIRQNKLFIGPIVITVSRILRVEHDR